MATSGQETLGKALTAQVLNKLEMALRLDIVSTVKIFHQTKVKAENLYKSGHKSEHKMTEYIARGICWVSNLNFVQGHEAFVHHYFAFVVFFLFVTRRNYFSIYDDHQGAIVVPCIISCNQETSC